MIRSLRRGLDVLEALAAADSGGLGPSAIADALALDKATVARVLSTLVDAAYVVQDRQTRRYRLTAKLLRLATAAGRSLDLRQVARPHLVALRQQLGETVHLGILEELHVVYVDKLESRNSIQLVSRIGQTMPLHSTSLGKAILAALPEAEREAIIKRIDFAPRTERTIVGRDAFRRDLRLTAARGYATEDRENEPLGACVAAPILGSDGRPQGAISLSGPHYRISEHFTEYGETVRASATAIGLDLGASDGGHQAWEDPEVDRRPA